MVEEPTPPPDADALPPPVHTGAAGEPQQGPPPMELDATGAMPAYANYCRINSGPEEMILDFCLHPSPFAADVAKLKVQDRIVLSYYTAKRLHRALEMSLERYEATFGVLEPDVRRRAIRLPDAPGTGGTQNP